MTQPLSPEALAWLRQSDLVDGSTYSRALLHLLERVEALEARPIPASPARPAPGPQSAPAIFPVEYADADGDGIRIAMEPAEETGRACWVVRNSRHINACHEFSTPEAAHAAHQAAKPAQPTPAAQPAQVTSTATLLQQLSAPAPAVVPVAVSERPWEKGGWTDLDGECWWCPPDGPAYWSMANPAMVYGGWLLPASAILLPQAGEVEA